MIAFEVNELAPGDDITAEQCEKLIGLTVTHHYYPMHLLNLAKQIEADLWRIGRKYTVQCKDYAIRVLTHAEAKTYNESVWESGKRKMRLSHRRAAAIDTSSFTDEMRREHYENLSKQGKILSSLRRRHDITLEPTIKTTPKRS